MWQALRSPVPAHPVPRFQPSAVDLRLPAALWDQLKPSLWSRDGLAALTAAVDQLASSCGLRAVRAGLSAAVGADAGWLLSHAQEAEMPRGISSYRFARLLPLRSLLGGSGRSQYAAPFVVDATPACCRLLRQLRAQELPRGGASLIGRWHAAQREANGLGAALACKQRLAQAQRVPACAPRRAS